MTRTPEERDALMRTVRITPQGALAAAFAKVAKEAAGEGSWWRASPLLSGIGLAYHLDESGWEVRPKPKRRRRATAVSPQNVATLDLLRRSPGGITALRALEEIGTLRLAARIAELRAAGYVVRSEMIRMLGGKYVARYTLEEQLTLDDVRRDILRDEVELGMS